MSRVRRWFADQSVRRKLAVAGAAFGSVIALLLATGWFAMDTLSTVRAYVAGEGLYSKSQKEAVAHLVGYAHSKDPREWDRYRRALEVPLADARARLELEKPDADLAVSDRAFIEGRNHPDDVHAMSVFFRRFRHVEYVDAAITLWAKGDALIEQLDRDALELHRAIEAGELDDDRRARQLARIDRSSAQLTIVEDEFSFTLAEAARWLRTVLLWVMLTATLLGSLFALWVAWIVSSGIVAGVANLRRGTALVAAGELGQRIAVEADDELGRLAHDFNAMTDSLARARDDLVEHERLKSEFFANTSHELRTPLALILAPLESLLGGDYGDLPARVRTPLETMHHNASRLLQILQGLLDFQKLDSRKLDVHREPIDLAALTRSIVSDFEGLMRQRGLRYRVEIADERSARVLMDRYLFERIAFNLLSNAVKFTPDGGDVLVRLRCDTDRAVFSVADTGIGIRSEDQPRLFERFQQIEGASTRRFEGVGLGLALVKEFVELLDGTVTVASRPGEGSTFTIDCAAPAARDEEIVPLTRPRVYVGRRADPPLPDAPERAPTADGRVLVAEDNRELARYVAECLAPVCEVRVAADGEEALGLVRTWSPTIVLADVMMPTRDGLSLCRAIKSDPVTRTIPVVLLTALTYREALLRGWEAGADDYLFKPFHPTELVTRIRALLATQVRLTGVLRQLAEAQQIARLGSWEWDLASNRMTWSDELYELFGAERSGDLGFEDYLERVHPEDRSTAKEIIARAREAKEPFAFEHRFVGKAGVGWSLARGRVHLDDAGACVRMTGTAHEITEQKQSEETRMRLAEAQAEKEIADHASRVKDEFLATVSHELRTPLNAVLGWTCLLRMGQLAPEKRASALEIIERNARDQVRLIDDLLDISRIVSGKLELRLEPVDLASLVHHATEAMRPRSESRGVRLSTSVSDVGAVLGDVNRLQQVLSNLLDNALKFTARGERIDVTLERSGSHAKLSVTDTGRGIREDFVPHVFERFRQGDPSTTRTYGGLGIGLAISKQIIDSHGGRIEVQSAGEDRGASFTVWLELASRSSELRGVTVLVVDDDGDVGEMLVALLEHHGAAVRVATSADEALASIARERADVLVSDIGGASSVAGRIPAVALTADGKREAGFDAHLVKPVEPAELVATVVELARPSIGASGMRARHDESNRLTPSLRSGKW